jgi:hypothetical protein
MLGTRLRRALRARLHPGYAGLSFVARMKRRALNAGTPASQAWLLTDYAARAHGSIRATHSLL